MGVNWSTHFNQQKWNILQRQLCAHYHIPQFYSITLIRHIQYLNKYSIYTTYINIILNSLVWNKNIGDVEWLLLFFFIILLVWFWYSRVRWILFLMKPLLVCFCGSFSFLFFCVSQHKFRISWFSNNQKNTLCSACVHIPSSSAWLCCRCVKVIGKAQAAYIERGVHLL